MSMTHIFKEKLKKKWNLLDFRLDLDPVFPELDPRIHNEADLTHLS